MYFGAFMRVALCNVETSERGVVDNLQTASPSNRFAIIQLRQSTMLQIKCVWNILCMYLELHVVYFCCSPQLFTGGHPFKGR